MNKESHFPTFSRLARLAKRTLRSRWFRYLVLPILILGLLGYGGYAYLRYQLRADIERAETELESLRDRIIAFHDEHGRYPNALTELITESGLPVDPFSPDGETYRYLNVADERYVAIYSVGSDGVDNLTYSDIVRRVFPPVEPNHHTSAYPYLQIEWGREDPDNAIGELMEALLQYEAWREEQEHTLQAAGNRQTHSKARLVSALGWSRAETLISGNVIPSTREQQLIDSINRQSAPAWQPGLDDLQGLIDEQGEVLEKVRAAAEHPYARPHVPYEALTYGWPDLYSLDSVAVGRLLISRGRWNENQGTPEASLQDYEAALFLQLALAQEPNFITVLVTIPVAREALKAVRDAVTGISAEQRETLAQALERLTQLKQMSPSAEDVLEAEHRQVWNYLRPLNLVELLQGQKYHSRMSLLETMQLSQKVEDNQAADRVIVDTLKEITRRSHEQFLSYLLNPLELEFEDWHDPSYYDPNYLDRLVIAIRSLKAELAATRIAVALELHRMDQGDYPSDLSALEEYLGEMPEDPFSGQAFVYRPGDGGYEFYSVGHDGTDDGGKLIYTSPDDSLSFGDIIFSSTPAAE